MYQISEEAKERLLQGRVVRAYLKVLATETEEEFIINEENYLKDFVLEDHRYIPSKGIIGGATSKRIKGNFYNIDSNFNIENREFELYIGVELQDKSVEYLKFGNFIVQKPDNNTVNDNTEFEAFDYMIKTNKKYEDRLVYPSTLKELFLDVVEQCELETDITNFVNGDFVIENNPFVDGATNREVLQAIAEVAFDWVRIDENNKVVMDFKQKEIIDETITIDQYKDFNRINKFGPINVVVLKDSQAEGENITYRDETSIEIYGETELIIEDNPFAYTQNKRKQLIESAEKIIGLEYYPVEVESIGFIYLNCNDRIEIEDLSGSKYDTYLFNHTITYNGTVMDTIESIADTKNETKYQFTSDMINRMQRSEFIVDKARQQIEGILENQNQQEYQMSQIQQNINKITANVDKITNLVNEIEGIGTLALENAHEGDLISLHIYGNNTVFEFYPYPDEELYPDENLFPYGSDRLYVKTNHLYPSNSKFPNSNLYPKKSASTFYHLRVTEVLRQYSPTVYDEYVLENNFAYIIRRVGVNEEGNLYPLNVERIEEIGETRIHLYEGINYLYTDYEARMKVSYATRTSLVDDFAKVVEQLSNVSADKEKFQITVSKIIDEQEKTSKYIQTEKKITLEADEIEFRRKIKFSRSNNFI